MKNSYVSLLKKGESIWLEKSSAATLVDKFVPIEYIDWTLIYWYAKIGYYTSIIVSNIWSATSVDVYNIILCKDPLYFISAGRCGHGSPCEQLCYELHDGMYECDCTEGYELNKNGYSCQGKIGLNFRL